MISITPAAQEKLSAYLSENKVDPKVRIYLPEGGCGGGGQVSLAIDQPNPGDVSITAGDLELFMSRDLSEVLGKVKVDFKDDGRDSGFVVESENQPPAGESSGCGGCSCCG